LRHGVVRLPIETRHRESALLFDFLQLVDLFGELVDGVLLFLADRGDLRLVLYVRLLEVAPQLLQLRLALLVDLDLRLRRSAGLVQPLTQVVHLALQLHALLLHLRPAPPTVVQKGEFYHTHEVVIRSRLANARCNQSTGKATIRGRISHFSDNFFSSRDLIYQFDLDSVRMNQQAIYLGQRLLSSIRTQKQTLHG